MRQPFSDNIVFFDTEFSSLNPYEGEILSIGFVKMNGEKLYLELEYGGDVSDWVKENIIPTLVEKKISKNDAYRKILAFIKDDKPYLIGFNLFYDAVYYAKLVVDKIADFDSLPPFHWMPIDFSSILFFLGYNPEDYFKDNKIPKELGIDMSKFILHNALDDASLLREVYLKITEK